MLARSYILVQLNISYIYVAHGSKLIPHYEEATHEPIRQKDMDI